MSWRVTAEGIELDDELLEVASIGDANSYFDWPDLVGEGAVRVVANLPTRYLVELDGSSEVELLDITAGPYAVRWSTPSGWRDAGERFVDGGELLLVVPEGARFLDLHRQGR